MNIAVLSAAGRCGRAVLREALARGHRVTGFIRPGDSLPLAAPASSSPASLSSPASPSPSSEVSPSPPSAPLPSDVRIREKAILDLIPEDLRPFDAVIDCFGVWREEDAEQHTATLLHLAGILAGSGIPLLVVGGAGGLWADGTHTSRFHESTGFPREMRVVSAAQARSYDALAAYAGTQEQNLSAQAEPQRELPSSPVQPLRGSSAPTVQPHGDAPSASMDTHDAGREQAHGEVWYLYLCPNGLFLPDAPRTGSYLLAGEEIVPSPGAEPPLHAVSYADFACALLDLAEAGIPRSCRLSVYHGEPY